MKAAARILPGLRQSLRPVAVARVAGPSRVAAARFASTSEAAEVAEAEIPQTELDLPPNVVFEQLFSRRADRTSMEERMKPLHTIPADPLEPITQPLSSLASPTPTAALGDTTIALPRDVFDKPLRRDILHRNVVWYLSQLRKGNQSTKSRSTTSYSNRKLRPQKGSGKARVGGASSPIRRGGAPAHPLAPRDWAQDLPRKVRELGLKTALSGKLAMGALRVVDSFDNQEWKGTHDAVHALADRHVGGESTLRFGQKDSLDILFIHAPDKDMELAEEFYRKVRNVPGIDMLPTDEVTPYHLLQHKWVVLEADAVDAFANPEEYELDAIIDREFDHALRVELELGTIGGTGAGNEVTRMVDEVVKP